MTLDPSRTVAELRGAPGADRRRERRAARRLDGDVGAARDWLREQARGDRRARGRSTRPATSGSRSPGRSDRARADRRAHRLGAERRLARRRAERRRRRRGAAPDRRRGRAAGDGPARELGRRGGRALRPLALRLVGGGRLDARPGRAAAARRPRRDRPARTRSRAHGVDLDRALDAARRSSRARPPTSSCTSSRARCSSRSTCRSASSSARSASSARGSRGAARPRTPARRRWTSAATRSPAPRSSRSTSARSRARPAAAPSAPPAASSAGPGSSPRSSRPPSSSSTSATSTRPTLARMLAAAQEAAERFAVEENLERRVGADLADRADPVRRDADRPRRGGRSLEVAGVSHRLPSGPLHDAAEVSRAGVPTVMLFVQSLRGLSHTKLEDTKRRAPRAVGPGARPARVEDDRAGRRPGLTRRERATCGRGCLEPGTPWRVERRAD